MIKKIIFFFSLFLPFSVLPVEGSLEKVETLYKEIKEDLIPSLQTTCFTYNPLAAANVYDKCYRKKGIDKHTRLVELAATMQQELTRLEKDSSINQKDVETYQKELNKIIKNFYLAVDVQMKSWEIIGGEEYPKVDKDQVEKWISTNDNKHAPEALIKKYDQTETLYQIARYDCGPWGRLNFTTSQIKSCLDKDQQILVFFDNFIDNKLHHTYRYSPSMFSQFVGYCDSVLEIIGERCPNCTNFTLEKKNTIKEHIDKYDL